MSARACMAAALAGLALAACGSPQLVAGNARTATVANVTVDNEAAALALAEAHCRQHGRQARRLTTGGLGRVVYDCVE